MKWMRLLDQEFLPSEKTQKPFLKSKRETEQQRPASETVAEQEEKSRGLSEEEAMQKRKQDGENILVGKRKKRTITLFFEQYKDIMTMILLVCTAVSLFMGEYVEAITIAVIVLMNGILGFLQERKTERTLESLQAMAARLQMYSVMGSCAVSRRQNWWQAILSCLKQVIVFRQMESCFRPWHFGVMNRC